MNFSTEDWEKALASDYTNLTLDPDMCLPEVVEKTKNHLTEHLSSSPYIKEYLKNIPKGVNTNCPDSPLDELIRYIAKQNGRIDFSDYKLTQRFAAEIMRPVLNMRRREIDEAVFRNEDSSYGEYILFADGITLAEKIDELWLRWNKRVIQPYRLLSQEEKAAQNKYLRGELSVYDYSVFDIVDGKISNRQTLIQAWPELILEITNTLDKLIWGLEDENVLEDYFLTLRQAYLCSDLKNLDNCWQQVDEAWVKIGKNYRVFPVHGMENSYEHPYCVSPEYRLVVRSDKYQYINESMLASTIDYVNGRDLFPNDITENLNKRLRSFDIGIFADAIYSGVSLIFRLAGQTVPNRQEVLKNGGKIFIEEEAISESIKIGRERLAQNCLPEEVETWQQMIEEETVIASIVGHEFGHHIGVSESVDKALSNHKYLLEEGKATLSGMLAFHYWNRNNSEQKKKMVVKDLARLFSMLHKSRLENEVSANYVRENLLLANILFQSEIIEVTSKGVALNLADKNITRFFEKAQSLFEGIIEAYQYHDTYWLIKTAEESCRRTENIEKLIRYINR